MNVFGLSKEWLAVDVMLEESCGEINEAIKAHMETLLESGKEILEFAGFYRLHLERQAEVIKERRASLGAAAEIIKKKHDRLDDALAVALAKAGKQKFPEFTLSTAKRESVAFAMKPGVEVYEIPLQFQKIARPELDLPALKEARKNNSLPDQVDCVTLEKIGVRLRMVGQKFEEGE